MAKRKHDHILLGTIVAILVVGIAALFSASVIESQKDFGNIYSYFFHQLLFGVGIGGTLGFVAYHIPYKKWRPFALPILLLSILFLILVFIPSLSSGTTGGAKRWIELAGFSFQPSELAKLAVVIYLAAWLEARSRTVRRWNEGLVPFLVIVAIVGGLIILQPDMGTFGVIALTSAVMFFSSGVSFAHMGAVAALGTGLLFLLIKFEPYRMERLTTFLDSSKDPLGMSYQINQALLAIGSGGILGVGLGKSLQKYSFLPEPMKDSIFAVWSEEVGFVGALFLIALFVVLALRGLKIAKNARDSFGKFLALGITFWIISQAFVNMASMIGLVPLTGIPLPLVSYGGSSMAVTLAGLGILLNISKHN